MSTKKMTEQTTVAQEETTAPKTIATIDVRLTYNFREQFLEDYHHCPLCGTELLFTHVTQFVEQTVKEEAHCEPCKIRVKSNTHGLQ